MNIYYPTQIEQWAHSAWRRLDLSPPADLRAVCEFLGIRFERVVMGNDSLGMFIRYEDGDLSVKVNSGLPLTEQRFVWAHEIGHALLTRGTKGELILNYCRNSRSPYERECDRFATNLLMPEIHVRQLCKDLGHPHQLDKSRVIADHFGVDIQTMKRRLRELGLTCQKTYPHQLG